MARRPIPTESGLMDDPPTIALRQNSSPPEADSLLRSKEYACSWCLRGTRVLVSLASWGYLELIHYLQEWLYKDLPSGLDLSSVPTW